VAGPADELPKDACKISALSVKRVATAPVLCRGPFADMEPTNPRHKGDAVATSCGSNSEGGSVRSNVSAGSPGHFAGLKRRIHSILRNVCAARALAKRLVLAASSSSLRETADPKDQGLRQPPTDSVCYPLCPALSWCSLLRKRELPEPFNGRPFEWWVKRIDVPEVSCDQRGSLFGLCYGHPERLPVLGNNRV